MVKEAVEQEVEENSILIMIPVFNDWKALEILLTQLDKSLDAMNMIAEVLVVDDASITSRYNSFISSDLKAIQQVNILELRRNLGHQRAIAVGLAYIEANLSCQAVVVMDGDGEDAPRDVPRLINKCNQEGYNKLVFAQRTKRSETLLFKFFYTIYKYLYKVLTGQAIRVGNFSIIPRKILQRLVVVSEIWNHYAVGVLKARVPYTEISSRRGTRLAGQSQMNFMSLVTHGMSAISVYGDVVGVRLFIATCLLISIATILILVAITVKFTTNLAIPGWTSYMVALLFIILMQGVMLSLFFIFIILNGRNNFNFLPQRDYRYFILNIQKAFPKL